MIFNVIEEDAEWKLVWSDEFNVAENPIRPFGLMNQGSSETRSCNLIDD